MRATLDPPGPRARSPLGVLPAFRRDPLGFVERVARAYGDVAHFRFGRGDVYLLSHPDHVREVLVARHRNFIKSRLLQRARELLGNGLLTSEGEDHLRQRRMIQPSFHRERVDAYGVEMVRLAAAHADQWRDGATVDVSREMMRLTLAIAGKTLLGSSVARGDADDIGAALTDALGIFERMTNPLGPLLDRLPVPSTRRLVRARDRLDDTIHRIIEARRAHRAPGDDLLATLLDAQDVDGDGAPMSTEQVRDEILTIFLAGHETTANALAWTWVLLARHPAVEARLHAELDDVLAGRLPTPADFGRLEYTRRVLAESMRLYPPAWAIGRQPLADFELGEYRIREGSIVLMCPWVVHRDPRFFPDPLRFDPDRWMDGMEGRLPRMAYFPFGGGPRKCIGEGFAWLEEVMVLATLASRWRAELLPEPAVVPQPMITLRLRHGARVRLARRREVTA